MSTTASTGTSSCTIINPPPLIEKLTHKQTVEQGTQLTIGIPDDFHHHFRDGIKCKSVLQHATQRFGRCIVMPNLKPPITNTELALEYRNHLLSSLPDTHKPNGATGAAGTGDDVVGEFTPLMTLYLTDNTTSEEIRKAYATGHIYAAKYYPAGATTNSDFGVSHVTKTYDALRAMEEIGMTLCIHSEVSRPEIDIFDREGVFIHEVMEPLLRDFPKLKIVMEHISTREAVEYVLNTSHEYLAASITCHHLLYNRNAMLVGGIKPHYYCLPILKRETHRLALLEAATSGNPRFFAGTDSAPHETLTKETGCGCAGVYTAHAAVEFYAEAFEDVGKLEKLHDFLCVFGARHYGLDVNNDRKMILKKESWVVPKKYEFGGGSDSVTPLRAGESVAWSIVRD
jgi:dihydroorotase